MELQEIKKRYACPCDESASFDSFVVPQRGDGMWVWAEGDGEPYLDLVQGYSSLNFGHSHPVVVNAVKDALAGIEQIHSFHTRAKLELSQLLSESLTTEDDYKVYFDVGGSAAVSAALRLCRAHSGQSTVLTFDGGFHGTGTDSAGVTDDRLINKRQYGPNAAFGDTVRISYPDSYRNVTEAACLATLEEYIERFQPAAVILEPIQGANGFIIPSSDFVRQVREITSNHKVFMIDDEIQVGLGRAGYLYVIKRSHVRPDILLLSKSLAGGYYPLSALIAKAELFESVPRIGTAFQSTFNNNPFGTNISLRVLTYLIRENLVENAKVQGAKLLGELEFVKEVAHIDNLRGLGLAIAFEFVEDKATRLPAPDLAQRFIEIALIEHLMLYRCGVNRNVIKIAPPLTISDGDVALICQRIKRCTDRFQDMVS